MQMHPSIHPSIHPSPTFCFRHFRVLHLHKFDAWVEKVPKKYSMFSPKMMGLFSWVDFDMVQNKQKSPQKKKSTWKNIGPIQVPTFFEATDLAVSRVLTKLMEINHYSTATFSRPVFGWIVGCWIEASAVTWPSSFFSPETWDAFWMEEILVFHGAFWRFPFFVCIAKKARRTL